MKYTKTFDVHIPVAAMLNDEIFCFDDIGKIGLKVGMDSAKKVWKHRHLSFHF